jgi:hypothetical protein
MPTNKTPPDHESFVPSGEIPARTTTSSPQAPSKVPPEGPHNFEEPLPEEDEKAELLDAFFSTILNHIFERLFDFLFLFLWSKTYHYLLQLWHHIFK